MRFGIHPSRELVELFKTSPFQGQSPDKAKIIFLSSDANYSPEITDHPFFSYILEYHKNGVKFWQKYGCHHPFLLSNYPFNKTKGGRPFHNNFIKLGFSKQHAQDISFLELLDVPTVGNKSENKNQFYGMISQQHLKFIDDLVSNSAGKLFFVSHGVLNDMFKIRKTLNVFNWLDYDPRSGQRYHKSIGDNKVIEIYHFSSSHIHSQLPEIETVVHKWLQEN